LNQTAKSDGHFSFIWQQIDRCVEKPALGAILMIETGFRMVISGPHAGANAIGCEICGRRAPQPHWFPDTVIEEVRAMMVADN
jgi:hypothetical protein